MRKLVTKKSRYARPVAAVRRSRKHSAMKTKQRYVVKQMLKRTGLWTY